jgi:membrane protein DedA with SNARE-associated domain
MMLPVEWNDWIRAWAIALATFGSEDATCIATGLLIRAQRCDWWIGVGACILGIFVGDLGLMLSGRLFGRRVMAWRWIRARLPEQRAESLGRRFNQHGWAAICAARFLPGTRLPVYLAAGMFGYPVSRFAVWSLVAALLWTPTLVLMVAGLGGAVINPLQAVMGAGWPAHAAAFIVLWFLLRTLHTTATSEGRARAWARVSRLWRWEFWPLWLFYAPLVPWLVYLSVRHRGPMTPTAANPGIRPHGGIAGESKFEILSRLPMDRIVPSVRIDAASINQRVEALRVAMKRGNWTFPLILKPDAGQRGHGVHMVHDMGGAARYLEYCARPVLAQAYHPGPLEAGIFYVRTPDALRGHIFSITEKRFPVITGDGRSTVRSLIWRDARLRMQAATFLARLGGQADDVPRAGASLTLAIAGNHCQGTMFCDGSNLVTPALEQSIDAIARHMDGFHFGRFDIRYGDAEALRAGRDFAIVELNGVTSESTNLYDPTWSLWRAYRVLFRQWKVLFEIGDGNRRRGHAASSMTQVLADVWAHFRDRCPNRDDAKIRSTEAWSQSVDEPAPIPDPAV